MRASPIGMSASRRSVLQDVHGGKKLLPKPGRIPTRNTHGGRKKW
jgi:hypothetical protein